MSGAAENSFGTGTQVSVEHGPNPSRTARGIPLAVVPALVLLVLLVGATLIGLVLGSLRPGALTGADLGIADWRALFADRAFWASLRLTVFVAAVSTATAAVLAVAVAAALQGRANWLRAAVGSAIPMPHLVAASLAVTWLAPGGLADRLSGSWPMMIGDRHGVGIILVYVYKETPFLALLVLAAWDDETLALQETAAGLGAGPWARLRDVVFARVGAPLGSGALIVAAFTLGATEVPLIVGPTSPDTLATYALTTIGTNGPDARAQATAALVVTCVLSFALGVLSVALHRRHQHRGTA